MLLQLVAFFWTLFPQRKATNCRSTLKYWGVFVTPFNCTSLLRVYLHFFRSKGAAISTDVHQSCTGRHLVLFPMTTALDDRDKHNAAQDQDYDTTDDSNPNTPAAASAAGAVSRCFGWRTVIPATIFCVTPIVGRPLSLHAAVFTGLSSKGLSWF